MNAPIPPGASFRFWPRAGGPAPFATGLLCSSRPIERWRFVPAVPRVVGLVFHRHEVARWAADFDDIAVVLVAAFPSQLDVPQDLLHLGGLQDRSDDLAPAAAGTCHYVYEKCPPEALGPGEFRGG